MNTMSMLRSISVWSDWWSSPVLSESTPSRDPVNHSFRRIFQAWGKLWRTTCKQKCAVHESHLHGKWRGSRNPATLLQERLTWLPFLLLSITFYPPESLSTSSLLHIHRCISACSSPLIGSPKGFLHFHFKSVLAMRDTAKAFKVMVDLVESHNTLSCALSSRS